MSSTVQTNDSTTTNRTTRAGRLIRKSADQAPELSQDGKGPAALDWSKPISILLREGTDDAHAVVDEAPGARLLVDGELAKSEYIRYLFMLWHVYDTLERALFEHREHSVIYHIYHPRVFSRATALSFDICHLLGTVTWQTDPFYVDFFNNIPASITAYTQRISYLGREDATEEEVTLLAAHAYVRYLADLSGGQMIRRKIIKAYDLYDDGDGIAFYNFRTLDQKTGDRPAESHELRRIKDWFKAGLDEAITDKKTKVALVEEANRAYDLNKGMFYSLDGTKTLSSEPTEAAKKTMLVTGGTSIATLAAVVLAVSLAHFFLTVGGYTGSAGLEKFYNVIGWLKTTVGEASK